MDMIRAMFFFLRLPFGRLYIKLRFKNYWNLRRYLQASPHKHKFLWHTCDHWFQKQGSYVGRTARFENTPFFPHGCVGVFISKDAVIGRDAVIFHHVTIGSNTLPGTKHSGAPVIGDGVYIGAGAKLIGGITVGDHCRVGANAVVYEDMPPHSVALCAPTRIVQKENLDNTFRAMIDGREHINRDGYLVPAQE